MRTSELLRIAATLASALLMVGCHRIDNAAGPDEAARAGRTIGPVNEASAVDDDGLVACRPAGAAGFTRVCALDRGDGPGGQVLTLHNPDGGFHRLQITRDGRGVIAADGAEHAGVTIAGSDLIEVSLGGDRYRLPATIRARAPAR